MDSEAAAETVVGEAARVVRATAYWTREERTKLGIFKAEISWREFREQREKDCRSKGERS